MVTGSGGVERVEGMAGVSLEERGAAKLASAGMVEVSVRNSTSRVWCGGKGNLVSAQIYPSISKE